MTAHERFLELCAARFDFALTPAERDALERHLAACGRCRSAADGMDDDARRLGARPPLRLSPAAADRIRASLERPRRSTSPAMVLVAAALLALAAIAAGAVGAGILRWLDDSRLALVPAPSADVSPSALPSPSAAAAPPGWQLVAREPAADLPFETLAIVGEPDRRLAVGVRSCTGNASGSFDCHIPVAIAGLEGPWTVVAGGVPLNPGYVPPLSGPEAGAVAAAAGPDGYLVVGYQVESDAIGQDGPVFTWSSATAWWSPDGRTWEAQRLGSGARPAAAYRTADRWLVGGVVYGADRPTAAVWTSTDGRSWTLLEDAEVFDVGGYVDTMEDPGSGGIRAFAWNGTTLVAGGQVCAEGGLPCTAAAWVSGDGTAWERVGSLAAGEAVEGLVSVNGSFVAAVRQCPASGDCATVILHSGDGRAWATVPAELLQNPTMAVSDGTVVLVTGEYRSLDVRASADGATWALLGTVPAPERVNWGAPVLLARPGGRVDILIRVDPLTEPDTEADVYTALWEVSPAP